MDPATAILKKTFAGDQEQNLQSIETLLAKDKAALNSFRAKHCLPFQIFTDVPEAEDSDDDDDDDEEKPFLRTVHNLGGDHKGAAAAAYRSPWTNRWYVIDDAKKKGTASDSFEKDVVQLYYGRDAVGSVFLKPNKKSKGKSSFEGIFGVQKHTEETGGAWDSVHFVQVDEPKDKACEYRVESAVVVSLNPYDKTSIGCSLNKDTVKKCKIRPSSVIGSHLENLGTIIEAVEIEFRSKMERVDVPKTMEVMQSIYRKQKTSATAHLIGGGADNPMATGMGVGAGMIGEIANKAKAKKGTAGEGGPNPFMAAVEKNMKAKEETTKKDVDGTGDQYTDLKKTLKARGPNPLAKEAMAMKKKEAAGDGTFDYKAGLKKSSGPKKSSGLTPPTSPTPEFMNFRNKLKKAGK
eukprot:CAMPEP_0117081040 /NCGR_PEP_ID=MMETSP0472-20121206/57148_1 /TAXON_ID=693140 ORGANISM="Tiarina fusus, Strain LIS" /NCGR_SAMPLE_ID=MMETSP0472 /ASSEMBLY_ACC=CAM_ASM_000603 /LENGTH=406 /DNA_ID=CAMNT_0004808867 /DNA_START=38 /DNA_END=1258 /DNA_ORIENTATION=-